VVERDSGSDSRHAPTTLAENHNNVNNYLDDVLVRAFVRKLENLG
jgi:hypothetical protein